MVSGLNQQQNRNLQFGAQGAVSQNTSYIQNAQQAPYNQQGQNFGALTSKPDTFENSADPNFGAIDKQALEQGAQEITKTVEDSPFTQMLKNMFGIDIHNPKKTFNFAWVNPYYGYRSCKTWKQQNINRYPSRFRYKSK